MEKSSILVIAGASADCGTLDPTIEAARTAGLHVSILVIGLIPMPPTYAYGLDAYQMIPFGEDWQDESETTRKDLTDTAMRFETRLSDEGVSGEVAALCSDIATLQRVVARMTLTVDAVLVSDDLRAHGDLFDAVVQTGLFHSPTGLLLNAASVPAALKPARIFVAWNTGLPAARALHAARHWLTATEEITVGLFDPDTAADRDGGIPGSDVARWLSHRGYRINVQQYPSGGEEIGSCIRKRARETGTDLIVMGAYGHSRMRETIFGGTTRTLVAQTDTPVLLAH